MLGLMMGNANLTLAQSLYPVDKPSLFEDKKAKTPRDLVTVIIVEQAQARQTARLTAARIQE